MDYVSSKLSFVLGVFRLGSEGMTGSRIVKSSVRSVRVAPDMMEKLADVAHEKGTTGSKIIRTALKEYFDRIEMEEPHEAYP